MKFEDNFGGLLHATSLFLNPIPSYPFPSARICELTLPAKHRKIKPDSLTRLWDRIQFAESCFALGEARGRECVRSDTRPTEQRSPRAKQPLPEGLRRFWLVAS